jgi:serine/threonine protein kinase
VLNGLCLQKMAAMASQYVCPVLAVCEDTTERCMRVAVPRCETLAAAVVQRDGPLPLAEVLHMAVCLAKGLARLHVESLLHLDVNPDTVYVFCQEPSADIDGAEKQKQFLVGDFWASRLAGGRPDVTPSGPGATECRAPEKRGCAQGDVYALGMVIAFAATGKYDVGGLQKFCEGSSNASDWELLKQLVMAMVSKLAKRTATMAEVVARACLLQKHAPPPVRWHLAIVPGLPA